MIPLNLKRLSTFALFLSFASKGVETLSEISSAIGNGKILENYTRHIIKDSSNSLPTTQNYKDCNCGSYSNKCYYKDGNKICECFYGYAENSGKCARCDCGYWTHTCKFKGYTKICTCYGGQIPVNGKCTEVSNCDCGYYSKKCEIVGNSKLCTCDKGYVQKDGKCVKACDCGTHTISCYINYLDIRKCNCETGYVAKPKSFFNGDETCTTCECGSGGITCSIDYKGIRRCVCSSGYSSRAVSFINDDETCIPVYSYSFAWRLATYIETVIFIIIIISLLIFIVSKKSERS